MMQWKRPKLGDKRKRHKFLFLPKKIGGEVRWLETALWEERCEVGIGRNVWSPTYWLVGRAGAGHIPVSSPSPLDHAWRDEGGNWHDFGSGKHRG